MQPTVPAADPKLMFDLLSAADLTGLSRTALSLRVQRPLLARCHAPGQVGCDRLRPRLARVLSPTGIELAATRVGLAPIRQPDGACITAPEFRDYCY
jgi:hypothetical protein